MPGPRRSFFACSAGGGTASATVFVAGGHDEEKNALRSAMAYDAEADEWAPLPDMAVERDECRGAFLNGGFHVVGGYPTDRQGQFCKSAETFDVATWRWGAVEEDRLEDATCPMTCVDDGDGGEGRLYFVRSGHVVVEECGKWKEVAEVPEDAAVSTQLMTWQGKLLLVGSGSDGGGRVAYLLEVASDVDDGKKSKLTWHRMEVPEEYSGHVHAACCLEI
ncbi:putative F-box/kelch-repeat protein [Iris pallida]|uniref:F-box/kelch-repeat protein n=1 Tax=Iris pallida TaxID=29817 RepID=A0AAX6E4S9_IRIPA|nr:putative F-box/kelch-repeat protein [Iris pallida]